MKKTSITFLENQKYWNEQSLSDLHVSLSQFGFSKDNILFALDMIEKNNLTKDVICYLKNASYSPVDIIAFFKQIYNTSLAEAHELYQDHA